MGNVMGSRNAPEPPKENSRRIITRSSRGREQQEQHQHHQQVFDLQSQSYTPRMWMEDLERLGSSANDVSSPFATLLLCPLHHATASGRVDVVQLMLGKGYDKDALDGKSRTPLQVAARAGLVTMVQAILSAGADVNLRCLDGRSALDMAGHVDVARAIIEHGADVNAADTVGRTALHKAARDGKAEMVSLLCLKGATIDAYDDLKWTALQHAASRRHVAAARALLAAGADVTLPWGLDCDLSTLEVAMAGGEVDVVTAMIEHGADVNAAGTDGRTPLHKAAVAGKVGMVSLLCLKGAAVDTLDNLRWTALQQAAARGHADTTQALLNAGADNTLRCGVNDMSALDLAVAGGYADVVTTIVEHGADVNAADPDEITHLHVAAVFGKAEMVRLLSLKGAAIDALSSEGYTPLHVAVKGGFVAAARALLAAGADVTLRCNAGGSALEWAAGTGLVDIVRAIIEHGADVNEAGPAGSTPMHSAVLSPETEMIDVLVEAGGDIERQSYDLEGTPLHRAAGLVRFHVVVALLKHGANVGAQNAAGETPLHVAAAMAGDGSAEVVDALLRGGADEKAVTSYGNTAADMVGCDLHEEEREAEDFEHVRRLLAKAPADRAWRRRGYLVMCRAHYPSGRVQLRHGNNCTHASVAKRTRSRAPLTKAEVEWVNVASMVMGAGDDLISLMGDGANLIFEKIVGFL